MFLTDDLHTYNYYIRPGVTDARKNWGGLSELVQEVMKKELFSKSMFLFCNKSRKVLKIILWDNGYWVLQKRLVKGTFCWPQTEEEVRQITVDDVIRLISGEDVFRRIPDVKHSFHKGEKPLLFHVYFFITLAIKCRLCYTSSVMESKEKTVDIKASSEGLLKEIEALRLQSLALTEENKQKDKKIELLEEKQADYEKTIEAQKKRIADLWEQLAKRYKKTTEVYHDPNQPLLFNELELEVTNAALNDDTTPKTGDPDEDLKTTVRSYVRHKSKNTILTLPADTPVTDIYIDNGPKKCSACGSEMVKDGERVYEAVTKTVTYAIVRKHYTLYKCPNCEGNEEDRKPGVPKGDMLAGTVVDPTLLADVVVSKFDMGSTLYRIERELRYRGVPIPRESISAWLMRCGNAMLGNLDEVLKMEIFKYPLINVDETPTKVLKLLDENGEKKAPNSKYNGFMVSITGIDKDGKRGLTILIFTDNRRNETIRSLLEGYNGCVQTDGLEGYNYASEEIGFDHLGCLAHARRKAVEAMGSRKSGIAYEMVKKYRKIFHVESQWNEKRGTISLRSLLQVERQKCCLSLKISRPSVKRRSNLRLKHVLLLLRGQQSPSTTTLRITNNSSDFWITPLQRAVIRLPSKPSENM